MNNIIILFFSALLNVILFSKYLERIKNSLVDIQKTASYNNIRRKPSYMLIHWLFIGLHIDKRQNLDYSLRPFDRPLQTENGYVKFLGMCVDDKLQWRDAHIDYLSIGVLI